MGRGNGITPPLGATDAAPAARPRGVHGIRHRDGLPGDDAAPEREIHDSSPTSYRTAREGRDRADTAVEVPVSRRKRATTDAGAIVAQVSTEQLGSLVADEIEKRLGSGGGSGGGAKGFLSNASTLIGIIAVFVIAALFVASKADGADLEAVKSRVRSVEDRAVRLEAQVKAGRRDMRLLIRRLDPELASALEPLEESP